MDINQITLECLINKYQKSRLSVSVPVYANMRKDKKFYRRRILNLTKDMLINNYSEEVLDDVKDAFDKYVKTCIGYFKIKDETDIIQEDYNVDNLELLDSKLDLDDIVSPEEADKLMMRSIKINKLPLDDFVKIKYLKIKKEAQLVMPKQKEINLKDPTLKKKGIPEKNNINKPYKDEEKKMEDST